MASILETIKKVKQPSNGFLPINQMEKVQLEDSLKVTEKENIPLSVVGIVIDYMTRFLVTNDLKNSFRVSLTACLSANKTDEANALLNEITGINSKSIVAACKLVAYDCYFREDSNLKESYIELIPDEQSIENIKNMITRALMFISKFGPITKEGITFEGGYTDKIDSGDGDFITDGIMWDIKISNEGLTIENTLQLLIHYIMGKHSNYIELQNIYKIGFFNPRHNVVYMLDTDNIDETIIKEVEQKIIGY